MLKGAAVQVDITPPVGVSLAGYAKRTAFSVGIHDPLSAQVMMITSAGDAILIIALDLIAINTNFVNNLRANISDMCKVERQAIMVACSHTHSGPEGFLSNLPFMRETPNPLLEEITLQKISGAARWVEQLLQPVRLSFGFDQISGVGLNRNDPDHGPVDQQLSVLRLDNLDGRTQAVLFNYGCHPTVMGSDNLLISADYPGAVRQHLQKKYPETVFLFCNGGAGDVSTRFSRREASFTEVDRLGAIVAGSVLKAMNTATPCQSYNLAWDSVHVNLPVKQFPDADQVKQLISHLTHLLEIQKDAGESPGELRKLETRIEGAQIQLLLSSSFNGLGSVTAELQKLMIGEILFFGIPGECFSKTVLEIKQHFNTAPTVVVGYANGYVGYLPDLAGVSTQTYEDFVSPYTTEAAQLIKQIIFTQLGI